VREFIKELEEIPVEKRVYVDQSGMGDDERPARGYSKKGTLCVDKKPSTPRCRLNMMAGLVCKKIIEPLIYRGSCTALLVEEWLKTRLFPAIPKNMVVFMDNAPFHRKKIIEQLALPFAITIKWLPKYSPDLNHIEPWWAVIKKYARSFLYDNHSASLDDALVFAFNKVP
jgi:transposase